MSVTQVRAQIDKTLESRDTVPIISLAFTGLQSSSSASPSGIVVHGVWNGMHVHFGSPVFGTECFRMHALVEVHKPVSSNTYTGGHADIDIQVQVEMQMPT